MTETPPSIPCLTVIPPESFTQIQVLTERGSALRYRNSLYRNSLYRNSLHRNSLYRNSLHRNSAHISSTAPLLLISARLRLSQFHFGGHVRLNAKSLGWGVTLAGDAGPPSPHRVEGCWGSDLVRGEKAMSKSMSPTHRATLLPLAGPPC